MNEINRRNFMQSAGRACWTAALAALAVFLGLKSKRCAAAACSGCALAPLCGPNAGRRP